MNKRKFIEELHFVHTYSAEIKFTCCTKEAFNNKFLNSKGAGRLMALFTTFPIDIYI